MIKYRLYCEICNWKKLTDGTDVDLFEIKTCPIPGGYPVTDPITQKTTQPKSKPQPKKFRCPQCGRAVIPRKITDPQNTINEKKKIENSQKERAKFEKDQLDKKVAYGKNWLDGDKDGS